MENENGNPNPSNEEMDINDSPVIEEADDVEVLKEKFQKLSESNQKLYARTKKAEGFEFKEGKWTKPHKEEKPAPKVERKASAKSDDLEFDSGDRALLRSYDVKGADEMALAKTWMKRTGDDIDVMAGDEIFQAKLKSLREAKASQDAIPKGKNRTTLQPQNEEQYWAAKVANGEASLNEIPDVEIRRKVLNARIEKEKSGSKFSSQPIKGMI